MSLPVRARTRFDWKVYDGNDGVDAVTVDPATTGQIIPVNTGHLEGVVVQPRRAGRNRLAVAAQAVRGAMGRTRNGSPSTRLSAESSSRVRTARAPFRMTRGNCTIRTTRRFRASIPMTNTQWLRPMRAATGVFPLRCGLGFGGHVAAVRAGEVRSGQSDDSKSVQSVAI